MLSFGVKSKSVLVMLLLKPPAYSTVVVKPSNAVELFSQADADGGLIEERH